MSQITGNTTLGPFKWDGGGGSLLISGTLDSSTISLQFSLDGGITKTEIHAVVAEGDSAFNVGGPTDLYLVVTGAGGSADFYAQVLNSEGNNPTTAPVGGASEATLQDVVSLGIANLSATEVIKTTNIDILATSTDILTATEVIKTTSSNIYDTAVDTLTATEAIKDSTALLDTITISTTAIEASNAAIETATTDSELSLDTITTSTTAIEASNAAIETSNAAIETAAVDSELSLDTITISTTAIEATTNTGLKRGFGGTAASDIYLVASTGAHTFTFHGIQIMTTCTVSTITDTNLDSGGDAIAGKTLDPGYHPIAGTAVNFSAVGLAYLVGV